MCNTNPLDFTPVFNPDLTICRSCGDDLTPDNLHAFYGPAEGAIGFLTGLMCHTCYEEELGAELGAWHGGYRDHPEDE